MDLKVPISIVDELAEDVINSTGTLDLASGEIRDVVYEDYDVAEDGLPAQNEDYEFSSGLLTNGGRDVEFRVDVDVMSGKYSVTPSELLELKGRAAKLFSEAPPKAGDPPAAPNIQPRKKR
ncbi:hypothetical protein BH09PSE5_BH09PSE5_20730 [soil metagenome]